MNELTLNSNVPTMSSREIADLVESRHDDVKRSIERLATTTHNDDGTIKKHAVISKPPMADGIKSANGVAEKIYLINKRDSYIIVAQLSPAFTAKLVDRWQELEAKQAQLPEIRDPQLAMIISMAQSLDAIKTKQEAQKVALEAQNARLDGIEAKNKAILDGSKFYSVAGFASLHGIKIDIKAAATYGRAATAESRALGIMIGSIPDPRFGKVHTYHEDVLAGVFAL